MIYGLLVTKNNSISAIVLLILSFSAISIVLSVIIINTFLSNHMVDDSIYGNWDSSVLMSYTLDNVLSENYSAPSYSAICQSLEDYFIDLYPSGIGLNLYDSSETDGGAIYYLASSNGSLHTLFAKESTAENSLVISIDDHEHIISLNDIVYEEDYDDD